LLPIWTDEQKNIQNLLLGIGGTATAAGGFTFIFTITF
jgi:glycerate kinase